MSGGHFDYHQRQIEEIIESLEEYLNGHELDDEEVESIIHNYWSDIDEKEYVRKYHHTKPNNYNFDKKTIKEFKKGLEILRKAYVYAQRIDWLLSGDDGEESFHERLKEDLEELKGKKDNDNN